MDFGYFRETYCSMIVQHFFGPTCFENMNLRRVIWPKCQVKQVSYIDPLVMKFSPKSEFLIGKFHQHFGFLVKPYFLFLQYRKSVLKKTQILGPLFEPCSSCACPNRPSLLDQSLVELSNILFEKFRCVRPKTNCLALCLGKRGPPCENIGRDLHFAPVVGPF